MDGDGSSTPASCCPCSPTSRPAEPTSPWVDVVRSRRGVWPWHARLGNALIAAWLRHRTGWTRTTSRRCGCAAARHCSTSTCATAGSAIPLELLGRSRRAGWRVSEHDVDLPPPCRWHPVEGVRLGHAGPCVPPATSGGCCDDASACWSSPRRPSPDGSRHASGARRSRPGRRPRRRGAARHPRRMPRLRRGGYLSLAGELAGAARGAEIAAALDGWTTTPQRGAGFAERLVARPRRRRRRTRRAGRHGHSPADGRRPVHVAARMGGSDAVLGPADRRRLVGARAPPRRTSYGTSRRSRCRPRPPSPTRRPPSSARGPGSRRSAMTDVDTLADADLVAALAPDTRFAEAWRAGRTEARDVIEQSFSDVFASALGGAPRSSSASATSRCAPGAPWSRDGRRVRPRAGRACARTDSRHRLRPGPVDRALDDRGHVGTRDRRGARRPSR